MNHNGTRTDVNIDPHLPTLMLIYLRVSMEVGLLLFFFLMIGISESGLSA